MTYVNVYSIDFLIPPIHFRVLREVEGIKIEAMSLKEQMQMVKDVIKGVCTKVKFENCLSDYYNEM